MKQNKMVNVGFAIASKKKYWRDGTEYANEKYAIK